MEKVGTEHFLGATMLKKEICKQCKCRMVGPRAFETQWRSGWFFCFSNREWKGRTEEVKGTSKIPQCCPYALEHIVDAQEVMPC
jgi:hypothetical protein